MFTFGIFFVRPAVRGPKGGVSNLLGSTFRSVRLLSKPRKQRLLQSIIITGKTNTRCFSTALSRDYLSFFKIFSSGEMISTCVKKLLIIGQIKSIIGLAIHNYQRNVQNNLISCMHILVENTNTSYIKPQKLDE